MKRTHLTLSIILSSIVAGSSLAYASTANVHGLKSATVSNFPSKKAQQSAPHYVVAIDNNLDENIHVTLSDPWSTSKITYSPNSINFPYTNDDIQSANVRITSSDDFTVIYSGPLNNGDCITITADDFVNYQYRLTHYCMPLREVLSK